MPAQAAARVKTSVLAIGRRDFVESKCRLVGYRRAEPARAELGHNSAELIRQDMQAHVHAHGVQTQEAEMLIQALIVANGRATVSRQSARASPQWRAQPRECSGQEGPEKFDC